MKKITVGNIKENTRNNSTYLWIVLGVLSFICTTNGFTSDYASFCKLWTTLAWYCLEINTRHNISVDKALELYFFYPLKKSFLTAINRSDSIFHSEQSFSSLPKSAIHMNLKEKILWFIILLSDSNNLTEESNKVYLFFFFYLFNLWKLFRFGTIFITRVVNQIFKFFLTPIFFCFTLYVIFYLYLYFFNVFYALHIPDLKTTTNQSTKNILHIHLNSYSIKIFLIQLST